MADVDLYRYDSAWEKEPLTALAEFYRVNNVLDRDILLFMSKRRASERQGWEQILSPCSDTVIIDLRQAEDYEHFSLPGSLNFPLVEAGTASPFSDPKVMSWLWKEFEARLESNDEDICSQLRDKHSLIMCYDGDSARVATSVLRAKGYIADNTHGGIRAIQQMTPKVEDYKGQEGLERYQGQSMSSVSR